VDIIRVEKGKIVRDITVNATDEKHMGEIVESIKDISGVRVLRVEDRTFSVHKRGKIEVRSKIPVSDKNVLSQVYTPGVARICMDIYNRRENAYTNRRERLIEIRKMRSTEVPLEYLPFEISGGGIRILKSSLEQ